MSSDGKSSGTQDPLNVVIFMSSARNSQAHWGGDKRAGTRVLNYVKKVLADEEKAGEVTVTAVYDPVELQLPVMEKPHFFYAAGEAPEQLETMAQTIAAADAFVLISAEYNHSIPPGLSNTMGYFGGSKYAFKASAIVTYSPGPYGGARVAPQLRAFTGELGCLSVSPMLSVPHVQKTFAEDGTPAEPERMARSFGRVLSHLKWFAHAMRNQRRAVGTADAPKTA